MRVRDIMSNRPITVRSDSTVGTAARLLARHQVTAVPVVDAQSRLIGVLSEADLLGDRARPADLTADVMSRQLVVVHPETDVAELQRILMRTVAKSVPVVDASDQVVGVVSRSDVVRALARDDEELQEGVMDALVRAGVLSCRVQVHHGVVELSPAGVDSHPDLPAAAAIAACVTGVSAVHPN
ncbi:MAG: CBS domain-containing protein [Propionibacteriales bacterium]|nr:CBS domain-containing protein [Propionibacteriales bacterium]